MDAFAAPYNRGEAEGGREELCFVFAEAGFHDESSETGRKRTVSFPRPGCSGEPISIKMQNQRGKQKTCEDPCALGFADERAGGHPESRWHEATVHSPSHRGLRAADLGQGFFSSTR